MMPIFCAGPQTGWTRIAASARSALSGCGSRPISVSPSCSSLTESSRGPWPSWWPPPSDREATLFRPSVLYALDDKPACPLCGDTGWQGAKMCQCLKKLCAQEQIKELSKLLDLGEQSFDSFRMDYYSETPYPGMGSSPRKNMELVYDVCLSYARKFESFRFRNLLMSGAPGLGKTFLSACIARAVSEHGYSVVYDTAGAIFAQFEAKKFLRDSADGQEARDETRRYLNCDLLIVDDLGSELTTQLTQSALYELINARLVAQRHTVISTNLSLDEIARRYNPQIASRIEGEYHVLHFFGDDIRLIKKNRL